MNKYRPELINLKAPEDRGPEIRGVLADILHSAAKLKSETVNGQITFTFYPTKSEYFLLSVKLACLYARDRDRSGTQ